MTRYRYLDGMGDVVTDREFADRPAALAPRAGHRWRQDAGDPPTPDRQDTRRAGNWLNGMAHGLHPHDEQRHCG